HAVGPCRDRDLLERDVVPLRERGAQPVSTAVGVPVQLAGRARHRLEGGRERSVRPLVGGELDHALEAELALDLLDRLPWRGQRGTHDRAHGAGASPCVLRQATSTPAAATKPARTVAEAFGRRVSGSTLGTAPLAFRRAARLPTFHTAHPSRALRLFTIVIG